CTRSMSALPRGNNRPEAGWPVWGRSRGLATSARACHPPRLFGVFGLRFFHDFTHRLVGGVGPFFLEGGFDALESLVGIDAAGLVIGVGHVLGEIDEHDAPAGG